MIHTARTGRKIEYYLIDDCPKKKYSYWKEARKPGWYSTDDGYVVKIVNVKAIREYRGTNFRERYRVRFQQGASRYTHGRSTYMFMEALERRAIGLSNIEWWESLIRQEPGLIITFAMLVIMKKFNLKDHRYNRYQYSILREISLKFFGTDNEWRKLRSFFNHDKVRLIVQDRITKELTERGIDVGKVFDIIQKAEKISLEKVDKFGNVGDAPALLAVADRYAGLLGMTQKKDGQKFVGDGNEGKKPDELPGADRTYDAILREANIEDAKVVIDNE